MITLVISFAYLQILTDYPEELRGDVSLHLHKEILSLPLFETASEGCRKLLSLTIKVGRQWQLSQLAKTEMTRELTHKI